MSEANRTPPWWLWPTVLAIIAGGGYAAWLQTPPQAAKSMCVEKLRGSLRAPDSLAIQRAEIEPFSGGFELTITYQATNAFNAPIYGQARCSVRTDGPGTRIDKFDPQL
jgi:hypothetical protein